MNARLSTQGPNDRRRAVERLLAWGFTPTAIARQLHCSVSWVQQVRRVRIEAHADSDEEYVSLPIKSLLGDLDSR